MRPVFGVFIIALMTLHGHSHAVRYHQNTIKAPMSAHARATVLALSDGRFHFLYIDRISTDDGAPMQDIESKGIRVQAMSDDERLQTLPVGSQLSLMLNLSPLPQDGFFWHMAAQNIHARAKILAIDDITPIHDSVIDDWRARYRKHIQSISGNTRASQQAYAVVLSLLTGDRALIDSATRENYQAAGISHLLAISGAHVLFLAQLSAMMALFLARRMAILSRISAWQIAFWVSVVAAACYALFTGFDVPAARTVWFLLGAGLWRYLLLPKNAMPMVLCAALMVWFSPLVLLSAAFWLSFIAVWLLMRQMGDSNLIGMVKSQVWLFFAMLPLTFWLFGKVSLLAIIANLFWVGFFAVLVPINLLAGVLYPILPSISTPTWHLLALILDYSHRVLDFIALYPMYAFALPMSMLALSLVCAWVYLLPKNLVPRAFLALGALALALFCIKRFIVPAQIVPLSEQYGALLYQKGAKGRLFLLDAPRYLPKNALDTLIGELRARGVMRLDGLMVLADDDNLNQLADGIKSYLPVHHDLRARDCHGQSFESGGVSVRVVVGFAGVAKEVSGCAVLLYFNDAPLFKLPIIGRQPAHTPVLIDGASDTVWQLHRLMCQSLPPAIWLTQTDASEDTHAHISPVAVGFARQMAQNQATDLAQAFD